MTDDPKRTADIMRTIAQVIEVVGPYDRGERLQILVGAMMMLEKPQRLQTEQAERVVNELVKRAGGG